MSFDSAEQAQTGQPWEIYLFQTAGESFYYTSADQPITYMGQTYQPSTLRRDEMEETAEVDSGQINVYIPSSDPLAQLFIPYLPPTPMALTIFGGHYNDSEVLAIFTGAVASASFTDECQLVCRSDKYLLQHKIPKQLYQAQCNHIFGDPGCGIDLGTVTYAGVITAIDATGTVLTIDDFESLPHSLQAGYLSKGNDVRAVVAQTGTIVTLLAPLIGLEVGDAVSAVAGCQHTYPACQGYDNVVNFQGFDLIPTINPFDETTSLN